MTARLQFLSEAHQTVRDDIALTKRATEKARTDVTKAQEEKLNQVCMYSMYMYMYVDLIHSMKLNVC